MSVIVVALILNIVAVIACTISASLTESKFESTLNIIFALANAIFIGINLMRL